MDPISLPFILSLVTSYLVDGADKPAYPPVAGLEQGLTDGDLWARIASDSDTLAGMTFEEAVRTDPRRIDARVQQAVLIVFYTAINLLGRTQRYAELLEHTYLLQMTHLRSNGPITAPGLAEAMEQNWGHYSEIMAVAFSMKNEQAVKLQQALVKHQGAIFRGFREATEVLERAQSMAIGDADQQAWMQMAALIRDMWAVVNTLMQKKGGSSDFESFGAVDIEPYDSLFYEGFGAIHPGGEWEEYVVSGHRAPSHALPQFRRMGGRFYGGAR